jgi:hypothetical protein
MFGSGLLCYHESIWILRSDRRPTAIRQPGRLVPSSIHIAAVLSLVLSTYLPSRHRPDPTRPTKHVSISNVIAPRAFHRISPKRDQLIRERGRASRASSNLLPVPRRFSISATTEPRAAQLPQRQLKGPFDRSSPKITHHLIARGDRLGIFLDQSPFARPPFSGFSDSTRI